MRPILGQALLARNLETRPAMQPNGARHKLRTRVALGGFLLAFAVVMIAAWSRTYPAEKLQRPHSTRFVDRHGVLLFERPRPGGGYQTWVKLDDIAPALIQATLAGEDHRFYEHSGIDPAGVLRAIGLNVRAGRWAYGGSTITQQLAKSLDPQPRNLFGKTSEAFDALSLEGTLSKEQILTEYLNRVYYGRQAYGIGAAARRFYDKAPSELTLGQAALLAILPRAPTRYSPDASPEQAKARRAHVLSKMVERGYISANAAAAAASEPVVLAKPRPRIEARHVVDQVLSAEPSAEETLLSLDLALQAALQSVLEKHLLDIRKYDASQAGIVVVDNATGGILAMVGSRDYHDKSALGANNAVTALRPAGSTLKPFIYGMAFEEGYDAESTLLDAPSEWADYEPRNSHDHYHGQVSFGEALASSLNLPAVRLNANLGAPRVAERLAQFGFSQVDPSGKRHGLSLALGGARVSLLELATAYAALARGGLWQPSSLVPPSAPPTTRRVMSQHAASAVTRILESASLRRLEFGFETPLDVGFRAAAKTGTSSNFGDNWTVGYTDAVTVAVWVGNFDGRPLRGSLAMTGAAPLFHDAIQLATEVQLATVQREAEPTQRTTNPTTQGRLNPAQAEVFRITSPRAGTKLLIDEALPEQSQRVPLRTSDVKLPQGSTVRWTLNGRPLPVARGTQSWPLSTGEHVFVASVSDPSGKVIHTSDPVSVVVQGAQDVYPL